MQTRPIDITDVELSVNISPNADCDGYISLPLLMLHHKVCPKPGIQLVSLADVIDV